MQIVRPISYCLILAFVINVSYSKNLNDIKIQSSESQSHRFQHKSNHKNKSLNEDPFFTVDAHGVEVNGVLQPYKSYSHTVDDFDNKTFIAENPVSNPIPAGLSWNQELTQLFGVTQSSDTSNQSLIIIDPDTGVATIVGELVGLDVNQRAQGIAIDENDTCYVVATDNINHATSSFLYHCNLHTGSLTYIGSQDIAPDIHDITASCDGILYGTDSTLLNLYTINKDNGSATLIGPLGYQDKALFSMTYDRENGTIYQYVLHESGYHTAFAKLDKNTGDAQPISEFYNYGRDIGAMKTSCLNQTSSIKLNPGFNGSWYNPETSGQGFLIEVLPESNNFFAAWFTFSNVIEGNKSTDIGSTDHRWFSVLGELGTDNTVELTIYNTTGGKFNDPATVQNDAVGTMTMTFDDCLTGTVEFMFDDNQLSGVIPITRIASDNVQLCESLLNNEE